MDHGHHEPGQQYHAGGYEEPEQYDRCLEREQHPQDSGVKGQEPPATFEQMERLFAHLAEFMQEVDFHKGKSPDLATQRVRRLFLKAGMDEREIKIVRGLLSDAQRLLRQKT